MNIIIILQMIMKQKESKISGFFHLFLLHFSYFTCHWTPQQSPFSGRDLILINYVILINYIDFWSYVFSHRKMCIESKHIFLLLKEFEASVRKSGILFLKQKALEIPEITSYGQEAVLLVGLVLRLPLPVGMEICQGSEMIRALPQGMEFRE